MRKRKEIGPALLALVFLGAAASAACDDDGGDPQPLDELRFPTDLFVGGDGGRILYVVGSNFDRGYAGGAVQAMDLAELNARIDDAASLPVEIEEVPWLGGAHIASFGGRIAGTTLDDGTERLFVPIRGEGSVAVLDSGPDGELQCHPDGGTDCRLEAVELPTPSGVNVADPFAAVVMGDYVYVGALRTQVVDETAAQDSSPTAYLSRLPVDDPDDVEVRPIGPMVTRDLVPGPDGLNLFSIGERIPATGGRTGEIRSFPFPAFDFEQIPAEGLSLSSVVGSMDGRSMTFSADGSRAYVLTQSPSALVVFDIVTGAASMSVRSVIPMPDSPSRLVVIEREGASLAVVTSTRDDALAVVDIDREEVVAVLDGTACHDLHAPCPDGAGSDGRPDPTTYVGVQPWGVVATDRAAGGARVWVGSFADSGLRAVDIPDLQRPWMARVSAIVGGEEDQQ